MAKRSSDRRLSKPDVELEETGQSPKTVRIVCLLGTGIKKTYGAVTGKEYVFVANKATEVDEQDAVELLARKRGGCCGNKPTHIFWKEEMS